MRATVVVGNPKPASRTRAAAELVCAQLTGSAPDDVVDVVELASALLDWNAPAVLEAKGTVHAADLLVVASPTYKATYTGLLKLFLDQFGAGELGGVITVPLMLGAAPQHALAPELTLKPVLVEIGCSCPTPALYLLDSAYAEGASDGWLQRARPSIPAALA